MSSGSTVPRPAPSIQQRDESALPALEYILPLRSTTPMGAEFAAYLHRLCGWVDVTVVDGSGPEVFLEHARSFPVRVRHIRPDGPWQANGKVAGVLAGVRHARHELLVLADDDVRHTPGTLQEIAALLGNADLVRPQNYFDPLPWHARWDTARSLVNRAFGSDYPGTFGVRRSALTAGYRGDVLFENLEMIRTVKARGGREVRADGIYVPRRPPTFRHFRGQRIRQAYDSQAQPARLAVELSLLPGLLLQSRAPIGYFAWAAVVLAAAAVGRRREGGTRVFPRTAPLWAPLWLLERSVTAWVALALRFRGGMPYAGSRLRTAAGPTRR